MDAGEVGARQRLVHTLLLEQSAPGQLKKGQAFGRASQHFVHLHPDAWVLAWIEKPHGRGRPADVEGAVVATMAFGANF